MTTLRPFGPIVALTAAAITLTPRSKAARPSSLNITCFGMCASFSIVERMDRASCPGRCECARLDLVDDAQHVLFPHDQVLLVLYLDLGAGVLAQEDAVASLHVQRDLLALVVHLAGSDRDDLPLLGLLLRRVRNDDAALLHLLLLDSLDENPVVQRTNLHDRSSRCKMLAREQ